MAKKIDSVLSPQRLGDAHTLSIGWGREGDGKMQMKIETKKTEVFERVLVEVFGEKISIVQFEDGVVEVGVSERVSVVRW